MPFRKILTILAVLLLATAPLLAGGDRPFRGGALSEMLSFDPVTASATFEITSGNVTHLGRISGYATVYYHPVTWIPLGAEQTLVAANGDEVHIDAALTTYTITGGTGRFAGASGSGLLSAVSVGDPENGVVRVSWTGTISY